MFNRRRAMDRLGPGGVPCKGMRAWRIATVLLLLAAPAARAQGDAEAAWADWGAVLARYVNGEHVQYARWKAENPPEWRRFLAWLEDADPTRLSVPEQRAFWINAYNARVVADVLDRYPIDSVRDVGFVRGRLRGFFSRREHTVAGQRRSLDDIRDILTRQPHDDVRVHFALTLAAESSPPLRTEPYRGEILDTQLDFQTRTFLNGPWGSRLDEPSRTLYLTKLLSWNEGELEGAGTTPREFAARYLMGAAAEAATSEEWGVDWLDFDWGLNEAR